MRLRNLILSATVALLSACTSAPELVGYVDPKIGTGDHGHVFVGANVPFGMVQVGPTSIPQGWDWCSGYHTSDATVIGFSHTHLSGTGIGDLFDVTLMPVTGEVTYARGNTEDPNSGMWSLADRSQEVAKVGYYSVPLIRYNILAEMTATSRVGYHRYTFPASDEAAIVIDLQNGGCWDSVRETKMEAEGDRCIVGYRYSNGWARDQKVYFVAEFSKPFEKFEIHKDHYGRLSFKTKDGEQILVKVAISPVSVDGAKANMAAEMPKWPKLESVARKAEQAWVLMPRLLSFRTLCRASTVFLANRLTSLTTTSSNSPSSPSRRSRLNSSRFFRDVPLMPSSAYSRTSSWPFRRAYSEKNSFWCRRLSFCSALSVETRQ